MDKYYRILGLNVGASQDEIKKAYKKLALKHHPDHGGSQEIFKDIVKAYELLIGKRQFTRQERQEQEKERQEKLQQEARRHQQQRQYEYRPPPPPPKRAPKYVVREIDKYEDCHTCKGRPKITQFCESCDGTGNIIGMKKDVFVKTCPECNSFGRKVLFVCQDCRGIGRIFVGKEKIGTWEYW